MALSLELLNLIADKPFAIPRIIVTLPHQQHVYKPIVNQMKSLKTIILMVAMLAISFNAWADHDQVITFDQMPEAAKTFLKQHFADKVPLVVTVDWDDYTIRYETGEKVEFNKQGDWKEIDCCSSLVPQELIPEEIKSHIQATFPGAIILKLERKIRGYDVKLNNGLEVEYSPTFQVIDIDD